MTVLAKMCYGKGVKNMVAKLLTQDDYTIICIYSCI